MKDKDFDFDFDRVGKRLPYRVDEEALQRVTRNVLETCRKNFSKVRCSQELFLLHVGECCCNFIIVGLHRSRT